MMEKLIRLDQLQRFKERADEKYQDKLTAGNNININGNTISATAAPLNPTYTELVLPEQDASSGAITVIGNVTLMPGIYFLVYTCCYSTASITGNYCECGFSTNTTDITGAGRAWGDSRKVVLTHVTQTGVSGVFDVPASAYPNGRTYYFLAKHDIRVGIRVWPHCSYIKLA